MISAIFLVLTSLSWGQSTGTVSTSLDDELKISNLGKAVRELESGRYRQTGRPTFANGICFSDGVCQTSVPTGGGAGLSSTQTFTGANTFTSQVIADNIIHVSTIARPFTSSFSPATAHTANVCASTITITLNGATRLRVFYNGPQGSSAVTFVGSTFLIDSGYAQGLSATIYLCSFISNDATQARPCSWEWVTQETFATGSHTICIAPMSDTGNVRTCVGSGTTGTHTCQFGAEALQ